MAIDRNSEFFRDFVNGDLLYGADVDRRRYYQLAAETGRYYTIDNLTRDMDFALRGYGGDFAEDISQEEFALLPNDAQTFLLYARQTRQWHKMTGSGTSQVTKTGVYKGRLELGNTLQMSEPYFRAKCKAGIKFVLACGFTVRFVLDSLYDQASMETIARKESSQPWHTGSELRYLFRSRNAQLVQTNVVYYVNGRVVNAPCVAFPNAWQHYGQTRLD